jgi:hypothetical protein
MYNGFMRSGKLFSAVVSLFPLFLAFCFWLWSFTQTDPNLLYSWNSNWVRFQNLMWQIPRVTSVWWYVVNVALAFLFYLSFLRRQESSQKRISSFSGSRTRLLVVAFTGMAIGFLIFSNNALSHDIYNYMFNAKAVMVYSKDPHVKSALEIAPGDEWLRFMHNVHTEAPYGRTWTYMTLVPSFLGMGKFLPTFVAFKLFMVLGFAILIWLQKQMHAKNILLFVLNPLVLIETLMNGHNDVWMMALALGSLLLVLRVKKLLSWPTLVSALLLLLSTQIKEATLVLIPLWIALVIPENYPSLRLRSGQAMLRMTKTYWPEIAALLLFLPLFTERSQQFHPWYLIWALTFIPFMRVRYLQVLLVTFSLTSFLRYVPFLLVGEYTDTIQFHMRLITWSAVPIATLLWLGLRKKFSR